MILSQLLPVLVEGGMQGWLCCCLCGAAPASVVQSAALAGERVCSMLKRSAWALSSTASCNPQQHLMQQVGRELSCDYCVKHKLWQAREGKVAVAPARGQALLLATG